MFEINAFDPMTIVLMALLNPVVIAVAFILGRKSDQWQKVPVAAFAAALAGFMAYWLVSSIGLIKVKALGGEAGLVALQFVFGLVWAFIGYRFLLDRK
jgi:small neutral amino acid transporter SnatA (MarC family)